MQSSTIYYLCKMFDISSISQYDLVKGRALASLEEAITKSKSIFSSCDYFEDIERILFEKWTDAISQPDSFIHIYCSQVSEAICLINAIGLFKANCKTEFEHLGKIKNAGEIFEMTVFLEQDLAERRNSILFGKGSLLALSIS